MRTYRVAFLYDFKRQPSYHQHIHPQLKAVDRIGGETAALEIFDVRAGSSEEIQERVQATVEAADAVFVDVTDPNPNVAYEVGRFLRMGDRRLIQFTTASARHPRRLPFFLSQVDTLDLSALLRRGHGHADAAAELRRRLDETLAHWRSNEPMAPRSDGPSWAPAPENSDHAARSRFPAQDGWRLYRAPGAVFLFGEHAVTVGHPALALPLPLYVYVAVRDRRRGAVTTVDFLRGPDGQRTTEDELSREFLPRLQRTIAFHQVRTRGRSTPLEIAVWTQPPTMCGLGTSSAIAACLALEILGERAGVVPKLVRRRSGRRRGPDAVRDLLAHPEIERVFRLAWKLDLCFHSPKGSGAGVFASLVGTERAEPLLYVTEARRMWRGDVESHHEWQLGAPDSHPRQLSSAVDRVGAAGVPIPRHESMFTAPHFAVVYTGHPKATGRAIANIADAPLGDFFTERAAAVDRIGVALGRLRAGLRYPIRERTLPAYRKLVRRAVRGQEDASAIQREHGLAVKEVLFTAYGGLALSGINSLGSTRSVAHLALMDACFRICEALGLASVPHARRPPTHEPAVLADALNDERDERGRRLFGAKVTGGGMGGDLVVQSDLRSAEEFRGRLSSALRRARDRVGASEARAVAPADFGKVHFSSTWIPGYPDAYDARPACRIT